MFHRSHVLRATRYLPLLYEPHLALFLRHVFTYFLQLYCFHLCSLSNCLISNGVNHKEINPLEPKRMAHPKPDKALTHSPDKSRLRSLGSLCPQSLQIYLSESSEKEDLSKV